MKTRIMLFILAVLFALPAASGMNLGSLTGDGPELPFAGLLQMEPEDLVKAGFRFDMEKNRYVLRKRDFWGAMEARPKKKNYKVTVQRNETQTVWVRVEFTNPAVFHQIMDYIAENIEDYRESSSERLARLSFEADGLRCTLSRVPRYKAHTYSSDDGWFSSTYDISHEDFTFLLDTGNEPQSKWHQRQKEKRERKARKSRKPSSLSDLMREFMTCG